MGIIDIRYNWKTHRWTAKPRFVIWEKGMIRHEAPTTEASDPASAVYELCRLLPEDYGRRLQIACPERMYRSPEYEYMDDKCIEIDGHIPSQREFDERRSKYLFRKQIDEVIHGK